MTTEEETKRRNKPGDNSAVRSKYDAKSGGRKPDAQGLNTTYRLLPLSGDIGQKSGSVRRVFIERFIAAVAIVADAGGLEQDLRFSLGVLDCLCNGAGGV